MTKNLESRIFSEPSPTEINKGNKHTFSQTLATLGESIRSKGPIAKHLAGALASKLYATYGPEAQKEKAKLWEVGDSYFTKWDTTLGYGTTILYEHAPLLTGGILFDSLGEFSYGFDLAALNLITSTALNLYRFTLAFVFGEPFPSISLFSLPFQISYYRKEIKNWLIKK